MDLNYLIYHLIKKLKDKSDKVKNEKLQLVYYFLIGFIVSFVLLMIIMLGIAPIS